MGYLMILPRLVSSSSYLDDLFVVLVSSPLLTLFPLDSSTCIDAISYSNDSYPALSSLEDIHRTKHAIIITV